LATRATCFAVLLGSPADVFCPRTIVQNIKHVWSAKTLFRNKSCFFTRKQMFSDKNPSSALGFKKPFSGCIFLDEVYSA
jgi:hypothetical protein